MLLHAVREVIEDRPLHARAFIARNAASTTCKQDVKAPDLLGALRLLAISTKQVGAVELLGPQSLPGT